MAVLTKGAENALDLGAWQFLLSVVETLGTDGTSSDESECEDDIHTVFKTKRMPWRRRDLSDKLKIADDERLLDKTIYHSQGSKPVPRQRESDRGPVSGRGPPSNLPRVFYDEEWFESLDEDAKRDVDPSTKEFVWADLAVA